MKKLLIVLLAAVTLLIGCSSDEHGSAEHGAKEYYCPMHPEVVSDKPGICPICHMDLVLRDSGDESMEMEEGIMVNSRKQVLAGVSVVPVKKENLTKEVNVYSYLDFAEQNRKLITAKFNGRIERLYVDKTGDYINKGQKLFDIYSPDLVQAQNDYLLALNNIGSTAFVQNNNDNKILESARDRLLLMGITEKQIAELERSKEVKLTYPFYSSVSGTVIEKKVQEGIYVNEGTVLYDVAELSTLWNIAEVFDYDLNTVKQGSEITLTLQSYPGETFKGTVSLVYPVVNSQSRTVKVRSLVNNSSGRLRPNMYGQTTFRTNLGEGLTVPEEAVLNTGQRRLVWVKTGDKVFEPREVVTGSKLNGSYQILSGLKEGELVAASGSYLIDSESQLSGGTAQSSHAHEQTEQNK